MNVFNMGPSDEAKRELERNYFAQGQACPITNSDTSNMNRNPMLPNYATSHHAQYSSVPVTMYPNLGLSNVYGQYHAAGYSPVYPNSSSYNFAGTSRERFGQSNYNKGTNLASYPETSVQTKKLEKEYSARTLNEKFEEFVKLSNKGIVQPVSYTREEIHNITVSFVQPPRDPTLLESKNSSEITLIRRPLEGHRPIFNRNEIMFHTEDKRQDSYYELKIRDGRAGLKYEDLENYEVTRTKFKAYFGPSMPPSGFDLAKNRTIEVLDSSSDSENSSDNDAEMSQNSISSETCSLLPSAAKRGISKE